MEEINEPKEQTELEELGKEIEKQKTQTTVNTDESLDDIEQLLFVQPPKVGEETGWLEIEGFIRRPPRTFKTKEGKEFTDALTPRTLKPGQELWAYYLFTDKGQMNVSTFEVYFKLRNMKRLLKFEKWVNCGISVNIVHVYDGSSREESSKQAKDEGRLFEVKVKSDDKIYNIIQVNDGHSKNYKLKEI